MALLGFDFTEAVNVVAIILHLDFWPYFKVLFLSDRGQSCVGQVVLIDDRVKGVLAVPEEG